MTTTEDDCIEALRAAASILGESPTKAQYEDLDILPSAATILRVVGGWNEAKRRAGLETNPSRGTRTLPKPADVSLPDGTQWEDLTQDQRWHYKNVEWNTQRSRERRARHRAWLSERKVERGGCQDCEEDDPRCLDFHHELRAEKTMAVNDMVRFGYAKTRIRDELDRCVVVCANCHAKTHDSTPQTATAPDPTAQSEPSQGDTLNSRSALRAWSRAVRAESGCRECGTIDPRCLLFHHRDPSEKTDSVGALISDGRPFEEIRSEAAKCDVLCANCHRKLHDSGPSLTGESDSV